MDQLASIILFSYNRPWHTQQVLDTLSLNHLASESTLYIYCDGPKTGSKDEDLLKINKVKQIARSENRFKTVIVKEQAKNKGLAKSVIEGVTEVLNQHDKAIVLEDDLVSSPFFLQYMNDALNTYQNNEHVACISGYVYPIHKKLPDTFFIKGADCWGWATWKKQWVLFEENGQILLDELEKRSLTTTFDFENSYPYTQMLKEQIEGKNSSWAIRWYASAFLKDKYCLYPGTSLIQNIGIDGSGTHSGTSDKWTVDLASQQVKVLPLATKENTKAKKEFINYFHSLRSQKTSGFDRFKNKLKGIVKPNKKT